MSDRTAERLIAGPDVIERISAAQQAVNSLGAVGLRFGGVLRFDVDSTTLVRIKPSFPVIKYTANTDASGLTTYQSHPKLTDETFDAITLFVKNGFATALDYGHHWYEPVDVDANSVSSTISQRFRLEQTAIDFRLADHEIDAIRVDDNGLYDQSFLGGAIFDHGQRARLGLRLYDLSPTELPRANS